MYLDWIQSGSDSRLPSAAAQLMDHEEFGGILEGQLTRISLILGAKTEEYATDADQLSNIRAAAELQHIPMREAVAGMMAKHTVSIFTMCRDAERHDLARWEEKITDHIIWLILLRAVLEEESHA